jgi:5-methylcytosine-specific restriction protein A
VSPMQPRKPCAFPGCSALIDAGESRCATHRRQPFGDNRPSAAARGYGSTWRTLRARILERDPVCTVCEAAPSTQVDHRIPKHRGGDDSDGNLRGVCRRCHDRKTGQEGQAASR